MGECATPLGLVIDELVYRYSTDAHVGISEMRKHNYPLFCEDVSRRVVELLLCNPGVEMDRDERLGGTLKQNNKTFDAWTVDLDQKKAIFLQTKSEKTAMSPKFLWDHAALAKKESGDPKYCMADPVLFQRTFVIAAGRYTQTVDEAMVRIRSEYRDVTFLLFEHACRGQTEYYVPHDTATWHHVSAAVLASARARPEVTKLMRRIDAMHSTIHSTDFQLLPLAGPPHPCPAADGGPRGAPPPFKRRRERGPDDVYCHELSNYVGKPNAVACTKPGCGRWVNINAVAHKFHADVEAIRADQTWVCWHCQGACSLNACVRDREGGTATRIETMLKPTGNTKNYYSLLMEARAAGHKSVRNWVAAVHPLLAW
jgi:hypothetical protein